MNVNSVHLTNFMSHAKSVVNFKDRGLVLIDGDNQDDGGSNAAGKSSIFDGLVWCLFEETARSIDSKDDVISEGVGDTHVYASIEVKNTAIEIHRYRGHSKYGNKAFLVIDGKDKSGGTVAATNQLIQEAIGIDYKTFVSAVYLPQKFRSFAEAGDADQKSTFDKILQLSRFNKAHVAAKALVKSCKEQIQSLRMHENSYAGRIKDAKNRIFQYEQSDSQFDINKEKAMETLCNSITHKQSTITSSQATLDEIRKLEIELNSVEDSELLDLVEQAQIRIKALDKDIWTCDSSIGNDTREKNSIFLIDVEAEVARITTCPTCGQLLAGKSIQNVKRELEEQNSLMNAKSKQLHESIHKSREKKLGLVSERTDIANIVEQARATAEVKDRKVKQLETARRKLEKENTERSHIAREITNLRDQLTAKEQEVSPYRSLISKEQEALDELEASLSEVRKSINNQEDYLRYLLFVEEMYSNAGLKSYILDTVVPFVNERANEYISSLCNANIQFKTQRELKSGDLRDKLYVHVEHAYGGKKYGVTSGGEKQSVDICIMLALGDLAGTRSSMPISLRLLDEPADGLDALRKERLVEMLKSKVVPRCKTVFMMSHDREMKGLFDTTITVVKKNGKSYIQEN